MWKLITDCKKQIIINKKIRQNAYGRTLIYSIIDIEFDQYHLKLLFRDNTPAADKVIIVLNSEQIVKDRFEIEE